MLREDILTDQRWTIVNWPSLRCYVPNWNGRSARNIHIFRPQNKYRAKVMWAEPVSMPAHCHIDSVRNDSARMSRNCTEYLQLHETATMSCHSFAWTSWIALTIERLLEQPKFRCTSIGHIFDALVSVMHHLHDFIELRVVILPVTCSFVHKIYVTGLIFLLVPVHRLASSRQQQVEENLQKKEKTRNACRSHLKLQITCDGWANETQWNSNECHCMVWSVSAVQPTLEMENRMRIR